MDEQQQRVKDWMARYGLGTDPQVRMLDLSSEVGELAKEVLKSTRTAQSLLPRRPSWRRSWGTACSPCCA